MDLSDIERLEQLARVKAAGALTEDEFTTAKTALMRQASAPAMMPGRVPHPPSSRHIAVDAAALSRTWQFRFAFMTEHGLPGSPTYRPAFRKQGWKDRARLSMSMLGYLFGPFYLCYLGLWRPAISISAGVLIGAGMLTALGLPDSWDRPIAAGVGALYGGACIPLYYLKATAGVHSWNPLTWWRG